MTADPPAASPGHSSGSSSPTLTEALRRAAESRTARVGVVDRREEIAHRSWREIHRRSRDVANGLRDLGISRGDRVALVFPTGFDFVEAFFGCLFAGAIPTALYPPVRLGRLDEYHRRTAAMLSAVDAEILLCDHRVAMLLGETVARARPRKGALRLADLPPGRKAESKLVGREPEGEDLCVIQFSSGTTVDPKPIALSHRAVMAQVRALNGFWPDTRGVRHSGVSWLPLYHDMGLIGCLFAAVERPADLTLIPPELFIGRPAVWLRTMSTTGATISPGPNFAYGLCLGKIRDEELDGVDLSRWHVALNGAETVVGDVARDFCRRFARWGFRREAMTPVYGLSEAALAVTFSDIGAPFRSCRLSRLHLAAEARAVDDPQGVEVVSVGRPIPGSSVVIRDDCGTPLEDDQVGRVWIESDSLMTGYFANRDATSKAIRNGWLDTGDEGFMRKGELYLTGRAKDVLILRGLNHRPEDVEHALDSVDGVRIGCSAAVSFLPEGADGEVLLVLIERSTRRAHGNDDRDLARRCREAILASTGLEAWRIEVLAPGTLPRTSSGKIRRREGLRRFLDNRLDPPRRFGPLRFLAVALRSRTILRGAKEPASRANRQETRSDRES